jgi:hypothetical protein
VSLTIETTDLNGARIKDLVSKNVPWTALQAHAAFPLANVSLVDDSHRTALGTTDCWLYVVTKDQGDQTALSKFWFDPERPGPPIEYTNEIYGVLQSRSVLISDSRN